MSAAPQGEKEGMLGESVLLLHAEDSQKETDRRGEKTLSGETT